jgi:hypothetical protein
MDGDWRERGEEGDLCTVMREKRGILVAATVENRDYI